MNTDARSTYRFRFATDYGEVYAVAVKGKKRIVGTLNFEPIWKIGFAFCSPEDRGKPRTLKAKIGYGRAESRVRNGDIAAWFSELDSEMSWAELRGRIADHLVNAMGPGVRMAAALGIGVYGVGSRKGEFWKWFTDERFVTQFKERYAGGK